MANKRYGGRYSTCQQCGKRLGPWVKKFCSARCRADSRNARRREAYAANKQQ